MSDCNKNPLSMSSIFLVVVSGIQCTDNKQTSPDWVEPIMSFVRHLRVITLLYGRLLLSTDVVFPLQGVHAEYLYIWLTNRIVAMNSMIHVSNLYHFITLPNGADAKLQKFDWIVGASPQGNPASATVHARKIISMNDSNRRISSLAFVLNLLD